MTLTTSSRLRQLPLRLRLLLHPQSRSQTTRPSACQRQQQHPAQVHSSPSLRPSLAPKRQTSAISLRPAHLQAHQLSRHPHSSSKSPQVTNQPDLTTSPLFKQGLLRLPRSLRQGPLWHRLRLAHSRRRKQLEETPLPACLQDLLSRRTPDPRRE
jgi:hypothetical protein